MDAPDGATAPHMTSRLWLEEPEAADPFTARAAYCGGYDVYGDMLGRASWADMVFLLFRGEAPTASQAARLDLLAVALANPGPRDASVHAAMCGGVGGSPAAASLMAALAVGAGSLGGSREIALALDLWKECGTDLGRWKVRLAEYGKRESAPAGSAMAGSTGEAVSIWPRAEHAPGFAPHGVAVSTPTLQTLARLAALAPDGRSAWLKVNRPALESLAGRPLSLSGVAAAAFADLGFAPEEGEMLYLLLRLPGAAAHALEQGRTGHKKFPFYRLELDA